MSYRRIRRSSLTAITLGLAFAVTCLTLLAQDTDKRGRKYKAPPPTSTIAVTVVRNFDRKPIENAAVVFHPMQGDKDKGAMELKTDEDGKTTIDVIPLGDVVRLQVIAKGFQTYGQDYKIDKANMSFEIKLKRPGEQYSIYEKHPQTADAGKDSNSGAGKGASSSPDKPADSDKNAAKDKPADSSAEPSPQSSQNSPQPN